MARNRSAWRNFVEYAAVRAVVATAKLLPRRAVPAVASFCGGVLHRVLGSRRKVVRQNVALAYGDAPGGPDADALCRASLTSLCRSFLELFLLPPAERRDEFSAMVRLAPGRDLDDLRREFGPGPFVFAASHFGAYEIMGAACRTYGEEATSLMRPLDNPRLDAFLNGIRMRFGQKLAGNRGGLELLRRSLSEGRSVAVLVDLNMPKPGALYPRFFGVPAATAKTAALLAYRAGRPLVPVFCRREAEPFRFTIEIGPPAVPDLAAPDRDAELLRLLQHATSELETRVRAEPGQWLWTHRRFKTRPPEETPAA
jgi:KDO2-lipid IV(A) lauroyltransferase